MKGSQTFLHGIHTILITPFTPTFEFDERGHRHNVEFAAKSNAHALVCLGTQGEFPSLGREEQKVVMRTTVEAAAGRKPVICGASHSSTQETLDLVRYAEEIGADGVMIVPPYYSQVTWPGVYAHFETIAKKTNIPIVLYNAPDRAGINLTPENLIKLAELDNIVAVKQATRNIMELEESVSQAGGKLAVFGGSEAMMWPCLSLGMVGSSSTAASFMPQYFVDIYEAALAGRAAQGQEMFMRLAAFRRLSKRLGHAAVVKAAMDRVGLHGGPVRPPLVTPRREDLVELDAILDSLERKKAA